jgi:predicted Zn-dependent protease
MYLPQFVMGVALAQQDQCVKAIGYLHTAIELMADSPWAHYYIGSCLVKTGDYKTAAVHLEIATSRLPDFKDGHERLAYAYDHLGRLDDAKKERSKAEVKGKI